MAGKYHMRSRTSSILALASTVIVAALGSVGPALAQVLEPILMGAQREKAPLLDTLKDLVSIESGSRDLEGLDRLAALIADRLRALGGEVEMFDPGADL